MGNQIKGWKPASKYCNGVPVRTLRKAVDEGILPAHKDSDGVWTFEVADLDAWRAQHVTATAAPAPVAAAIAYEHQPDPAPRETSQNAPWLHAVPAPLVETSPAFERAVPAPAHEPLGSSGEQPFWLTQGLRAEVDTRAQLEAAHTEVTQLTQQLAQVTQQLRTARIGAVACATALESLMGAVAAGLIPEQVPQVTYALRDSAAAALAQLDLARLLHDDHALAVARSAVHVASVQIAQQIDRGGRKRRDRDDEMRAERERAARDEQDREHERQLAARSAAATDRFHQQQLAMKRRHDEELSVMRETIGAVATKRERNGDVDRERERDERDRARDDHERAAREAYQQRVQELQQQQADQVAALRTEIAAVAAKRRGRN